MFRERLRQKILGLILVVATPAITSLALADPIPQFPSSCDGYNPETQRWGILGLSAANSEFTCPAGTALMYHAMLPNQLTPVAEVLVSGICCPLPVGSLSLDTEFTAGSCREDRVVTGARIENLNSAAAGAESLSVKLRCTKLDTKLFKIEDISETIQLEFGQPHDFLQFGIDPIEPRWVTWNFVPAKYRYGFGRISKTEWGNSGCAGLPWGSVLTAIGNRSCQGFQFRVIRPLAPIPQQIDTPLPKP